MGPVFKHAAVDTLRLAQIVAPVVGDTIPENVVVTALDHVDGVDLHIAEMGDRIRHGLRPCTERHRQVEALGGKPDPPGLTLA